MTPPLYIGATQGRSAVLSLTIFDETTLRRGAVVSNTEMLVVVRAPATNPTHPNVISVPTQRIPRSVLQEARERAGAAFTVGESAHFSGAAVDSSEASGHDPVIYGTESALTRKFELSHALEANRLKFSARLALIVTGSATYDIPEAESVEEPIEMANVHVTMRAGRDLIPRATTSYSRVGWVRVVDFMAAVSQRSPAPLGPRFDDTGFCIQGLCMSSTHSSLAYCLSKSG